MSDSRRLHVTLAPEHAAKLRALADRAHVQEGTLARSLLSSALDQADPDPTHATSLLDAVPGAFERMEESRAAADSGRTFHLDEL